MARAALSLVLGLTLVLNCCGKPPNFNYDFSGFHRLTQMLATNCNNIEGQIVNSIGGIQAPSHDYNHIQCAADETMGARIKFIIHRDQDDDAVTGDTSKQRLEMYTRGRSDLRATRGDTFVYAWWFFLSSTTIATTSYWHVFQLKSSGASVDTNPTLTFTLKSNYGFHTEIFSDHHGDTTYIPMLSIDQVKGKWVQAFVKVNFNTNGYADVTLKDVNGNQLYHKKTNANFWWDGAEYYGPKWGLYRRRSNVFNDNDYIFFQNVQIWKA